MRSIGVRKPFRRREVTPRPGGVYPPPDRAERIFQRGLKAPFTDSVADLVQVARWIGRDRKLRTDAELEDEVYRYLQCKGRGPRVIAQVRRAVEWSKSP